MRTAARVDSNHRKLLDLASQLGGFVIETHRLGHGAPDAMVWSIDKHWQAVEIKTARGKLTPDQKNLHRQAPVLIWRTEADVCAHFGVQG